MKLMWWTLAIATSFVLTVRANAQNNDHENQQIIKRLSSTDLNKQIKAVIKQKKYVIANVLKPQIENESKHSKDCKSIAKLQCGCHFITSFDKTVKEPFNNLTFTNRCKFRKSMFECLANVSNSSYVECRHLNVKLLKSKNTFPTHMKEIIKVLLKTRDCVLGPEAVFQTPKKEKAIRVNSAFCAKLEIKTKKPAGNNSKQSKSKKAKKVAKKTN